MHRERQCFQVTATRDGRWWLLRVSQLDIVTQTRRLTRAEATVRDLIATWLGENRRGFDVQVAPAVGDEGLDRLISEAAQARARAAREAVRATALTRQAVGPLVARGIPVRDIGEMLGISHQRVVQLSAQR